MSSSPQTVTDLADRLRGSLCALRRTAVAVALAGAVCGVANGAATPVGTEVSGADAAPVAGATWSGLRLGTFGTLSLSRLASSGLHLRNQSTAEDGIGSEWTGAFDSRIGLHASAPLTDRLTLTVQPVIQRRNRGGAGLTVDWAHADWRLGDDTALRLGRFASPLFLVSDERQVGLAQPWVRVPPEVYGLLGQVDTLEGLWWRHARAWQDATLTVDAFHARHRETRRAFAVNHEPITGLRLRWLEGTWTWQTMYARARTRIVMPAGTPLLQALEVLQTETLGGDAAAARDYDFRTIEPLHFGSVGLRRDGANWQLQAEMARLQSDNRAFPGGAAAYLTVGRSVVIAGRNWSLWGTWSWVRGLPPRAENRFSGVADALIQPYLASLYESGQTRRGLVLRHDPQPGLALKLQIDHVKVRGDGRGGLFLEAQMPPGQQSAWLYGLALDWAY